MRKLFVPLFLSILSTFSAASSVSAQTLTGRIVDPSGGPVPRAYVRVIGTNAGGPAGGVFSDTDGRFRLATSGAACRLQVSLTGFETATVPCSAQVMEVTLALAPVREMVVVSATRNEIPVSQLGTSVTAFDSADLERRQSPIVADLLMASPGITVARTGAYGGITSAYVRGGESNYNKVLLDGIPLNEPGGSFNFNNVTSENLERVEIVRGAQSALFGSDAMSSVIQLVTRRGRSGSPLHASVAAEGGSFSTGRVQAAVSGATARADYSLAAARFVTDNDVENNAFRNTTVSATAGVHLSRAVTARGVLRAEIGKAGTPGQTAFGRADADAFFKRRDIVGGATLTHDLTRNFRQRLTYGLAGSRQASTNLELDPPYTPSFEGRTSPFAFLDRAYDTRTNLHRHYASYQADWQIAHGATGAGSHQLTAAADWDGERGRLRDAITGEETHGSRDNVGVTLQHQALWPRVFATGGVRLEHNASFGSAAVPRGAIAFVVHRATGALGETKLKTSSGLGIKEPTVVQSYSRNSFFLGNPDLQPERSRSLDAGIEQRFAREHAKVELTWFDNRYRNIISTRTLSLNPFRSQYFNIGKTGARGLELSGEAAAPSGLRVRGGYTLTASRVTASKTPDDRVFGEGQWLFRRPRHSGFVELSWASARASVDLFGAITGRRVDSDFSSLQPPITSNEGHSTWDARGRYQLGRRLALTLAADNITDIRYMEPLGYPALRRGVRAGLRVTF